MARLDRPDKHWKYNPGDVDERELWPRYMEAYQIAIDRTSTDIAPWYVVPADHKWYARLAVQHLLLDALTAFDQDWPPPTSTSRVAEGPPRRHPRSPPATRARLTERLEGRPRRPLRRAGR